MPLLSEQAKATESEMAKQIVFRHGRDFNYTGGKNEWKQKGVHCSARVKQNQRIKGHTDSFWGKNTKGASPTMC